MTQQEFCHYRRRTISEYAAEHVHAGTWSAEQAERRAAKQTDDLLPDGADTEGMVLLVGETAGEVVGMVWIGPPPDERAGWWIYDIQVFPAQRGRGYGRALLEAAEGEARRRGVDSIGLSVFGGNAVALGLYESSGYQVAAVRMRKRLASTSGSRHQSGSAG
jgi:ribosomal protein S18 acetylase RimI-like enzyme